MEAAPITTDPAAGTPKQLSLDSDQVATLVGGPCEVGKTYEVTLKAGEMGDDGRQSFDVVSSSSEDATEPELDADLPDDGGEADGPQNLGYNRSKLSRGRSKMTAPKMGMDTIL